MTNYWWKKDSISRFGDPPHLNGCHNQSLKSMVIEEDGESGGGKETEAEQDTVPGWVLGAEVFNTLFRGFPRNF